MEQRSLKQWREARDKTQRELAIEVDVTVGAVQGIESGRNEPHVGLALKLAQALGVHVEDVVWPIKTPQPRPKESPVAA